MLKAHDVAAVIIARMGRPWLDVMGVQKLLYDVQAWHLAIAGERLFDVSRPGRTVRSCRS